MMREITSHPNSKSIKVVQTIKRTALILDLLAQSQKGISLGELSQKASLPKGTCHRLVSSLAFLDYARQDQKSRNYFLGFRLVELADRLLDQIDFQAIAKPYLTTLSEKTNETVHLVILDQNEVLYIDKMEPFEKSTGLRMVSRVGSRVPAHCCAVGKVLLAYLPEERLYQLVREKGLPKRTEKTIVDNSQLIAHLELVRRQGYGIDDEENEKGIRCVASPLRNERGQVVAAISISGPAIRITKRRIERELKKQIMDTASEISRRLGFQSKKACK